MLPFNVWAQSLWETLYMVIVSTVISYAIGLPLGLTLVVTDKGGIRPMPIVNTVLGVVVNILRSVPFLILAVMITPITRAIVGKAIGTTAMIVPLTFAAAPYVARMVESSIKEVPFGVIEAAQSMGASPWQIVWKVLVPEAKPVPDGRRRDFGRYHPRLFRNGRLYRRRRSGYRSRKLRL